MEYLDIAFGLLLTAGVYCIIPLAVASLCKTSISKKKYIIICIVGEFVIAFAFQYWRTSTGVNGGSFTPAILWGIVFYNVGISILRKRKMLSGSTPPQQSPEPDVVVAPTPDAEPAPAPEKPVPPPPITETWYTCPSCGCLAHTGEVCACGYHPPVEAPAQTQASVKKRLPSVAVFILAVALACSVFYNAVQASEKANLRNDLSQADAEIASYQKEISDYKDAIESAREHNLYLKEDLAYLCPGLSSSFKDAEFRHDFRNNSLSYLTGKQESVAYWQQVDLQIAYGTITWNNN